MGTYWALTDEVCDYPECENKCILVKHNLLTSPVIKVSYLVLGDKGRRCLQHAPIEWQKEADRCHRKINEKNKSTALIYFGTRMFKPSSYQKQDSYLSQMEIDMLINQI